MFVLVNANRAPRRRFHSLLSIRSRAPDSDAAAEVRQQYAVSAKDVAPAARQRGPKAGDKAKAVARSNAHALAENPLSKA